jgi:hypothetical protein
LGESGWSLSEFSDALAESSRRRRREQDEHTQRMRAELAEARDSILGFTDARLLDYWSEAESNSSSNYAVTPREQVAMWRLMRLTARRELLRRMRRRFMSAEVHCGGCGEQRAESLPEGLWRCWRCSRVSRDADLLEMPGGFRAISAKSRIEK